MKNKTVTIQFGGIAWLATILLAVLNLTGVIAISWWWVFAPVLISFAFALAIIVLALTIALFGIVVALLIK